MWRGDPASQIAVHDFAQHMFGSKDLFECANYADTSTLVTTWSQDLRWKKPAAKQTI